ncbi:carboxymuconolactone decarboxylase family protein [Actinomadura sp. 9N407]|uniref:carboxymuconolactone decarboxylase family protein n=1 Tax=Actinomadura sp. 9N407 TaxID=3375154 RepID=UPI00378B7EB4
MSRIAPLEPPYTPEIERSLGRWMAPGAEHEPLLLFRVLHRNEELASRMFALGSGLLAHGRLAAPDREIVIARVTARAGCHYEWGVHAAIFASHVGLTPAQLKATTSGAAGPWEPRQQALIDAVDELHDTARLSESAWDALRPHYDDEQLLEFLVLTGWYRTISYVANGLLLENEPWARSARPD